MRKLVHSLNLIRTVSIVTVFCLLVSCSQKRLDPVDPDGHSLPHPGMYKCLFEIVGIHSGTKASEVTYATQEAAVNNWILYVFDSAGNYVVSKASSGNSPVQKYLDEGTYTICAVVNYPVSGSGALVEGDTQFPTLSAFHAYRASMTDSSLGNLMMAGSASLTVVKAQVNMSAIPVHRLVAKTGIYKISVDFSYPSLQAAGITIDRIFLTNVYCSSPLVTVLPESGLLGGQSYWYNALGYHTAGSVSSSVAMDVLTSETVGRTLAHGESYTKEYDFYFFPNPSSSAVWGGSWAPRFTRVVIQATLQGETVYYPISLPASVRNKTYMIDEVIIHRPGSSNPEEEIPGSVTVNFSLSMPWGEEYGITENS